MTGATAPANAIAYTPSVGTNCSVENNGHTLKVRTRRDVAYACTALLSNMELISLMHHVPPQWSCTAGSMGSFSFNNSVFNIKQFHVHFPAEHKFGTETKAGEVHFVAYRQGGACTCWNLFATTHSDCNGRVQPTRPNLLVVMSLLWEPWSTACSALLLLLPPCSARSRCALRLRTRNRAHVLRLRLPRLPAALPLRPRVPLPLVLRQRRLLPLALSVPR